MRLVSVGRKVGAGIAVVAMLALGLGPIPVERAAADPSLVDSLDMGYVRQVTKHLTMIGSVPSGFRVAGTPQDEETANYLADQMDAIGLEDVSVETLTVDGWLFEGASARVKGSGLDRTFRASSLGGIPGTPSGGVSGRIVPVGHGTAPEYRGLDVENKIVFAWWDYDNEGIWPNYIAYEAKAHGASAVIIASAPANGWYTAGDGRALGGNDAECSTTLCAPLAVISRRSAAKLVDALDAGRVQGTVELNAQNLLDSTGHQPIGQITGAEYPDRAIVFTAHQDAWFTSAADDSVGVAMMMAIAKAAIDSGYQPKYTWIFAPVTGEEYGLADAYYDWLQGAFHRITSSHTEWQTQAMAVLNWEVHSPPYYLGAGVPRELRSFLAGSLASSQADGLIDGFGLSEVYAWNDGFTYTAEGAPAVTFAAAGPDYWGRYHTDYDSFETLDFEALESVLQAETRVALDLDDTLMPYRFGGRIKNLEASIDPASMARYGADAQGVADATARLKAAWQAAKDATPSVCASMALREATRISEDELTALSFFDDTIYPHQQVQLDLYLLAATIRQLSHDRPQKAAGSIARIDLNGLAPILSRAPFLEEQMHHDPGYDRISWGAQGQLSDPIDLYGVWHKVASSRPRTDFDQQIERLRAARAATIPVYRARIDGLIASVNDVAAELEAVAAC